MKRKATALLVLVLALSFAGCRSRTDKSEGTVILSISSFTTLPTSISATSGPFALSQITVSNVPKDPTGTTSSLQTIEIRSYEVTYTRRDTGTHLPPTLAATLFSNVSVGANVSFNSLPFMLSDQTLNPPLLDLARNGVDAETGSTIIVLDVHIRFFGRTLAGDDIVSAPASFTIEVTR